MLSLRPLSSVLRRHYCACFKSTVASPDMLDYETAKPLKDMPGPKGRYAIPKIGPMFFMTPFGKYTKHTVYKLFDELHDTYGRTFCLELLGKCVVTADPDSIGTVYRNEGRQPLRATLPLVEHYFKKNNRQGGMLLLNGDEWQRLRSAAQKYMLKVNSASVYVEAQATVTNDLITRISTRTYTPEEFREELFKYATESIGVVCFNKRLGFLNPQGGTITSEMLQYLEAIRKIFELLLKDVGPPIYKIFPTKLYKDFERFVNLTYEYGEVQIKEVLGKAERQMKDGTFDAEEPNQAPGES